MSATKNRTAKGFTLVEIVLALAILAVAAVGFLSLMVVGSGESLANRQKMAAMNAAHAQIERMMNSPFEQVFALYNASPIDDPGGMGTAPGANFAVADLQPAPGDADGLPGRVLFPTVGGALREDFASQRMEMPRDLNNDGVVDANDHATDYRTLPVIVRVEWLGATGPTSIEFRTRLFPR